MTMSPVMAEPIVAENLEEVDDDDDDEYYYI